MTKLGKSGQVLETSTENFNQMIIQMLDDWITLFISIYQTKHVTPYMHILRSHIPQFIKIYGTLAPFSQQGLEKLNDDITKDYFRSTNHHDTELLTQLMFK